MLELEEQRVHEGCGHGANRLEGLRWGVKYRVRVFDGEYYEGREDFVDEIVGEGNLLMAQGAQDLLNAFSGGSITGGAYNSTNAAICVADSNPLTGSGNATFTNGSTTVTFASSQTFNAGDNLRNDADGNWYQLASAVSAATTGTLTSAYTGLTVTGSFSSVPRVDGGNTDCSATTTAVGGAITGITNVSNPVVTTTVAHGLIPGQVVVIAGVVGAVGANGTWIVLSAPSSTTYSITANAPGAYTSGGTTNLINKYTQIVSGAPTLNPAVGGGVSGVTNATNPTITTTTAHGLVVGNNVIIASVGGATGVNGTFTVVSVPSATTFTVVAAAPGVYTSGGTVSLVGIQYNAVFAQANANFTWNEFGLTNRGLQNSVTVQTGAHLANRKVTAVMRKFASSSSTFTITITVQ